MRMSVIFDRLVIAIGFLSAIFVFLMEIAEQLGLA